MSTKRSRRVEPPLNGVISNINGIHSTLDLKEKNYTIHTLYLPFSVETDLLQNSRSSVLIYLN